MMSYFRNIPENSPLTEYLPADYCDTFARTVSGRGEITPDELLRRIFTCLPWWVDMLMKLRSVMVKPLGLKSDGFEERLHEMIKSRSDREIIMGLADSHLDFYVSLWCSAKEGDGQTVSVTTSVKYNNRLGRIYFFFIRPFHKLIISDLIKRV